PNRDGGPDRETVDVPPGERADLRACVPRVLRPEGEVADVHVLHARQFRGGRRSPPEDRARPGARPRERRVPCLPEQGRDEGRGGSLGYTDFVEMVAFGGEDAVRRGVPSSLPSVAEFLARWRDQDEGILRLVLPGADGKFAFRLMDPSVLSKRVFGQVHASVLMSGTLFPAEMYADLLGIERDRRVIRTYGSPFPRSNRLLLVHPFLTTTY